MVINKVDFNEAWANSVSREEFVKRLINVNFQYLPEAERRAKLEEVYKRLTEKDAAEQPKGTKRQSAE
ncbi:MAG: hypothetical protein LBK94_13405 [Prevotellaceae bacterium]|jgi:hypothetical protein|nr:hypothetical protein [Prevotellaceae bacterium]